MPAKQSMQVTIPATEVHRNFAEVIRRAFSGSEHFVVEKEGLPVVAILSVPEFEELLRDREELRVERERRMKRFEKLAREAGEEIQERGLSEEDVDALVEQTRQDLYDNNYRIPDNT
jgi:prevent-host-death family protein